MKHILHVVGVLITLPADPPASFLHGDLWTGNILVRASLPTPRVPDRVKCDLQVRLADSAGIESNTLKTSVTFTP